MTKEQEQIIAQVQLQIKPNEDVDEEKISKLVNFFRMINPVSDPEAEEVVAELQSKLAVRMDRGAFVKERNHVSWYYAAKGKINPQFWTRYSTYLYKEAGFNSDVINSIDAATDEMMDLMSNPEAPFEFHRRGLVIGDVQSGKTSTYLALMNKAADAGYHIIILLTGTIEKLRRQTQGRTDEGFVGLDSTAFNRNKDSVYVGVGNIDKSVHGWAVTSTTSDFNTSTANKLSGQLSSISDPVVFVLKKNKSVLEKLETWLRLFNTNPVTGRIDMPLLLIDDEADNASVSTKSGEDPSTINKDIRKILKLFSKESYVGFTATPFANIFIDPDSTQEMLGDDLFPRDFIYALEAPTNYIGAASIFPDEGKYHGMIKDNSDCEQYVPLKHGKIKNHISRYHNARDVELFHLLASDIETGVMKYESIEARKALYTERTGRVSNIHKYNVLKWDEPSTTIPAHLCKDGLRHIHPDSKQARTITVREAARIQTFPDDYEFLGAMTDAYKMIGNAVPPEFARRLALSVYELLFE